MKLDVIIRTHDKGEVHSIPPQERYCGSDKKTVIKKCLKSLVNSLELVNADVFIYCLDDNSTEGSKKMIQGILSNSRHKSKFISLKKSGHNHSALKFFERAKKSKADLVYLIEDDYLHTPSAVSEMVKDYQEFKSKLGGQEVCLHPFDDPDNYLPEHILPTRVVQGSKRHWRVNYYTTFSFMCSPNVVRENWDKFSLLAKEYMTEWGEKNGIHEGTTINEIWRTSVVLFTPIPSLALHMQFERQKDKYINWESWWDSIK